MRRSLLSLVVLGSLVVGATCKPRAESSILEKHSESFQKFKSDNIRQYKDAEEEEYRFQIYARNAERINEHNAQNSADYELGPNQFMDKTEDEMSAEAFGFRLPENYVEVQKNGWLPYKYFERVMEKNESIPNELDWRKVKGRVSKVKNQGQCGSCWAFATTGMLEGQETTHKADGYSDGVSTLTALSEQDLVDCSKQNSGCQGGLMNLALQDIAKLGGIESENDYPYKASPGKCRFEQSKSVFNDKDAYIMTSKDEEKLKELVAKYGPVSVAIHAGMFKFQFYKHGVFYDKHCPNKEKTLNHAVLIVGYGHDKKGGDYWIVKNSWGSVYGEQGYIRMARNKGNMCGIATMPTIATF